MILLALLAGSAVAHIAASTPGTGRAGPPDRVVCTTGMVADLVRSVLGPDPQVVALMGSGVDPHLYKPTRDDVARLMAADLVVSNGLMLEGKMGDLLSRAGQSRRAISLGELLPAEKLISAEGSDAHPDPHVWMDPALWAIAAERFADAVAAKAASELAPGLRDRAGEYATTLRELDSWARTMVATIPPEQRVLITSHDAFAYLGRAYGLRVEGVQGVSTDSEPGLRRIRELVDLIVSQRVPAVFIESSVPPKSVEALVEGARAKGHEVRIGGELYSDAPGPAGTWEGTVPGMLDHNITTIVRALGGASPERGWKGRLGAAVPGGASPSRAAEPR